jgi:hypothetical protein
MVSSATAQAEEAIDALNRVLDYRNDPQLSQVYMAIAQVRAIAAIAWAVDLLAEAVREGFPPPGAPRG